MSKREHIEAAEDYERWSVTLTLNAVFPHWIDGAWHDVTDGTMALYHYVLAYAPQETA